MSEDGSNKPAHAIGEVMPDGTVYAGISPENSAAMYTAPADAPLTVTLIEAAEYVRLLNAQKYLGYDDWRLPTKGELNQLYENRAAIGGLNLTGSHPQGWYWSSTPNNNTAWAQRFNSGHQHGGGRKSTMSVRCVRG